MARWGCQGCSAAYGAWLSRCPRCGLKKGLVQVLNACGKCTAKFAVGLARCPHCGSTNFTEDWQMPKNTVHGGPSNATAGPGEPGYMPPGEAVPDAIVQVDRPLSATEAAELISLVGEHGPEVDLPFGATVQQVNPEGSEPSSPVPGTDSSTSSPKPETSPETSSSDSPPPAPRTASRSKRARTGGSSAPSAAAGQTGPASETGSDEGGEK